MQLATVVADRQGTRRADRASCPARLPAPCGSPAEALQRLVTLAARLVPGTVCWVALGAPGQLRLQAISGAMPADLSWHLALAGEAAQRPCLLPDLNATACRAAARGRRRPFRCFAGVPLRRPDGSGFGSVCLTARVARNGHEAEDRTLLADLALLAQPHALLLADPVGAAAAPAGAARDIAERKEAEAASLQTEKLQSLGRLTGGIAHDFNNLLTVISMNLEMLGQLVPPGDELLEYVEPARQAARSGADLTARLLAFAQRQPLHPEPVRLDRFLASLRDLAVRTIGGSCTIELRCAADLGACLVDRAQLESALLNLIVNARDAMPAGGRIVIAASNVAVAAPGAGGLAAGDYVSVTVSDEGVGVPPDILDRVFDPFFTTKPVGKGTGLGLSTVLGFARQSGGRVEIASQPGHGTSVVLYLPRGGGGGGAGAARSDRDAQAWMPRPWQTLVVDDAPDVLTAMTRMCRELGLRPTPAGCAEEAIALLHGDTPFDLLLTDVILPGRFGGAEIAREGRQAWPSLRVLFTSGYTDTEIVNRGRLDRDSELLVKPYSRQQLLAALRRVMEGRAA